MLKDPEGVLPEVLHKLNVELPSIDRVRQGIERQSFENKKKFLNSLSEDVSLPRGKDFNVKFLRKGISGDWKNYLSPRMARRIHAVLGRQLMDERFETNPEWFVHPSASSSCRTIPALSLQLTHQSAGECYLLSPTSPALHPAPSDNRYRCASPSHPARQVRDIHTFLSTRPTAGQHGWLAGLHGTGYRGRQ